MGALTLQEMRDEVRFTLGGYGSGQLSDGDVDRWLRFAQLHISRPAIYPHRELSVSGTFVLAAATSAYTLTSFGTSTDNVQAVRRVYNESKGKRLLPFSHRQYLDAARTAAGTLVEGEPTRYTVEGESLFVYPTPTTTFAGNNIRVFFYSKPAALSGTGAASTLAEDWDEVIVQGAVWRGFRAINQSDRAELAKQEFGQLINEVQDRLTIEHIEDSDGRTFEVEIEPHQQESSA